MTTLLASPPLCGCTEGFPLRNAHGVVHKRNLPQSVMSPIPDLRSGLDDISPSTFKGNGTACAHPVHECHFYQPLTSLYNHRLPEEM